MTATVHVVGFHGHCHEGKTPLCSEPVLESLDGRPPAELDDRELTRLVRPMAYRPGWLLFLLGPEDLEALRAAERAGRTLLDPTLAESQPLGACRAIYAERSTAADLWTVYRDSIRRRIEGATTKDELARQGWRLQRAALGPEDVLDALAALCRAEAPRWRDAVRAIFGPSPAHLRQVQQRASALPAGAP